MFERIQPETTPAQPTAPEEEGPTLKHIAAVLIMISLFLIVTFNAIHVGFVWTDTHFKGVEQTDSIQRAKDRYQSQVEDARTRCIDKVAAKAKGFENVTLDMCQKVTYTRDY